MSNKLDKLTPEQEALMPQYVKKWIDIGTSTDQCPEDMAADIVKDFRALIELDPDVPLVFANNPIESWVMCCLHEQGVPVDHLHSTMKVSFIRAGYSTDPMPDDPSEYQQKAANREYEIPQASLPFNDISLCSTFSFYDYMLNVVGVKLDADLESNYKIWERTSNLWAIYPLETLTVVCKKPLEVHLNENNVLHRDGGPALVFGGEGDFKIFALNGVGVPEYLAVTPSHKIDLDLYTKEQNADVKAEFVRKVGVERFLDMGKLIDTYEKYDQEDHSWWWKSEYKLYDMQFLFPSLEAAPYLFMVNQTTKIFHLEAVSPECQTLAAAIKERFGRDMRIVSIA